jgi:hypothetical protein
MEAGNQINWLHVPFITLVLSDGTLDKAKCIRRESISIFEYSTFAVTATPSAERQVKYIVVHDILRAGTRNRSLTWDTRIALHSPKKAN